MPLFIPGKGRLERVPVPLRPAVRAVADPLRRLAGRTRGLLGRLDPRRFARTAAFLVRLAADVARHRRAGAAGLTVGVDASPLWGSLTGVGWYLHRLLGELADAPGITLRLYGPNLFLHPDDPAPAVPLPVGRAVEVVAWPVPDRLALHRDFWIRVLRRLDFLFVAALADPVLFAPNFLMPRRFRAAAGALVVTVHDLSYRIVPGTLHPATLAALAARLDDSLARAARVVTDSIAVRREVIAARLVEPGRVRAVHLGPGHLGAAAPGPDSRGGRGAAVEPGTAPPADLPADLPPRFALHVGTLEPRKNLATLLAAWPLLPGGGRDLPLVVCGAAGWKNEALRARLAAATAQGWLVHLGYVPDAVLAALYRRALVVACPSVYEGFAFPLLEAMAAGTAVIASDIPVFREVGGGAALYAAAEEPAAWAAAVGRLAGDASLRARLAAAGREQAANFDWGRCARETLSAFREAAGLDSWRAG